MLKLSLKENEIVETKTFQEIQHEFGFDVLEEDIDRHNQKGEIKKNYYNKPKKIYWALEWGSVVPCCPSCDEWAYEPDRCVFCGQPFEWVESPAKNLIVEYKGWKAVQPYCQVDVDLGILGSIYIYKNGQLMAHESTSKFFSEQELKEHLKKYSEKSA